MDFFDLGDLLSQSKFFRDDSNLIKITIAILYFSTQAAGLLLIMILFGYLVYRRVAPTPQPIESISQMETQLPQVSPFTVTPEIQPTEVIQPTSTNELITVTAQEPTPTPTFITATIALPTPTATFTEIPTATSTTVVASISIINGDICSPIGGIEITELSSIISQPYNVPNPYSDAGHHGVDWGSYNYQGNPLYGNPVQAVFNGKVAGITINRPPIGNTIIIETTYEELPERLRLLLNIQPGQSLYHMYSHMIDPPDYKIGDAVSCGEMIGNLGQSQTAEAHLHFETRIGASGIEIGSMGFYDTSITESESQNYLWWRTSGDLMPFDPMSIFSNIY